MSQGLLFDIFDRINKPEYLRNTIEGKIGYLHDKPEEEVIKLLSEGISYDDILNERFTLEPIEMDEAKLNSFILSDKEIGYCSTAIESKDGKDGDVKVYMVEGKIGAVSNLKKKGLKVGAKGQLVKVKEIFQGFVGTSEDFEKHVDVLMEEVFPGHTVKSFFIPESVVAEMSEKFLILTSLSCGDCLTEKEHAFITAVTSPTVYEFAVDNRELIIKKLLSDGKVAYTHDESEESVIKKLTEAYGLNPKLVESLDWHGLISRVNSNINKLKEGFEKKPEIKEDFPAPAVTKDADQKFRVVARGLSDPEIAKKVADAVKGEAVPDDMDPDKKLIMVIVKESLKEKLDVSPEMVKDLGNKIGVDWKKISEEELSLGIKVETEHFDTVGEDLLKFAKIAHDHLKETPDYYKKLKAAKVESKIQETDKTCGHCHKPITEGGVKGSDLVFCNADCKNSYERTTEGKASDDFEPPKWVTNKSEWSSAVQKLKDAGKDKKDGKPNYGAAVAIYRAKMGKQSTAAYAHEKKLMDEMLVDQPNEYYLNLEVKESRKDEKAAAERTQVAKSMLRRIHKSEDVTTLEDVMDKIEKAAVAGELDKDQKESLKAAWDRRKEALKNNPKAPTDEPTEKEEAEVVAKEDAPLATEEPKKEEPKGDGGPDPKKDKQEADESQKLAQEILANGRGPEQRMAQLILKSFQGGVTKEEQDEYLSLEKKYGAPKMNVGKAHECKLTFNGDSILEGEILEATTLDSLRKDIEKEKPAEISKLSFSQVDQISMALREIGRNFGQEEVDRAIQDFGLQRHGFEGSGNPVTSEMEPAVNGPESGTPASDVKTPTAADAVPTPQTETTPEATIPPKEEEKPEPPLESKKNDSLKESPIATEEPKTKVPAPRWVVPHFVRFWDKAVEKLASIGKLYDNSGKPDYLALGKVYREILNSYKGKADFATAESQEPDYDVVFEEGWNSYIMSAEETELEHLENELNIISTEADTKAKEIRTKEIKDRIAVLKSSARKKKNEGKDPQEPVLGQVYTYQVHEGGLNTSFRVVDMNQDSVSVSNESGQVFSINRDLFYDEMDKGLIKQQSETKENKLPTLVAGSSYKMTGFTSGTGPRVFEVLSVNPKSSTLKFSDGSVLTVNNQVGSLLASIGAVESTTNES